MSTRRGWMAFTLAVFALSLSNCKLGPVDLPVKDSDDDADEALVFCDNASMCAGLDEEKLCHPDGFCVECITSADCPTGWRCDLELECERGR